eukprot:COSAG01_NODE_1447_length_10278_cov_47.625209_11_plen_103_part_00
MSAAAYLTKSCLADGGRGVGSSSTGRKRIIDSPKLTILRGIGRGVQASTNFTRAEAAASRRPPTPPSPAVAQAILCVVRRLASDLGPRTDRRCRTRRALFLE